MRKDKPSITAYKVAMNVVTLGTIPEMREILPNGIVEATETLLVASGAASARKIGWGFIKITQICPTKQMELTAPPEP